LVLLGASMDARHQNLALFAEGVTEGDPNDGTSLRAYAHQHVDI
jgi:hypothetical protein